MWEDVTLTAYICGWIKFFLFPNALATHYCMTNLCWWVSSHSEIHQPYNGSVSVQNGCRAFVPGLSWFSIHWTSIINLVLVSETISVMRIGLFMRSFQRYRGHRNPWYLWNHDLQSERWDMSNMGVISEEKALENFSSRASFTVIEILESRFFILTYEDNILYHGQWV